MNRRIDSNCESECTSAHYFGVMLAIWLFRTLEALQSRVVMEDSAGSGPCLTAGAQSSLELARVNRCIVDKVCIAVLRTLPSHAHHISSQSFLSPSELLAYKARIPPDI